MGAAAAGLVVYVFGLWTLYLLVMRSLRKTNAFGEQDRNAR